MRFHKIIQVSVGADVSRPEAEGCCIYYKIWVEYFPGIMSRKIGSYSRRKVQQ